MNSMKPHLPFIRRFLRRTKGSVAVEAAIILPVLLLVIGGLIDFGNIYYYRNICSEASREGARIASLSTVNSQAGISLSDLQTKVQSDYGTNGNLNTNLTVTMNSLSSNSPVTVTVSQPVEIITPLVQVFFPNNPYTVSASCTMLAE